LRLLSAVAVKSEETVTRRILRSKSPGRSHSASDTADGCAGVGSVVPSLTPGTCQTDARLRILERRIQAALDGYGRLWKPEAAGGTEGAMVTRLKSQPSTDYITDEEAAEVLEEQAQQNLHMSWRAFVAAWEAGEIPNPDRPEVIDLLALLPLARQIR